MKLIISAVNLTEGGPLKVLQDAVESAVETLPGWEIIVLVNRLGLINSHHIQQIVLPECKKSWFKRLCFEWYHFQQISEFIQPDLWLSLHDITPRVKARRQAVYCHNPSPFYMLTRRDIILDPSFAIFNLLYRVLYRVFISRNFMVIVQQEWLRKVFKRDYLLSNVVVAYPMQASVTSFPRAEIPFRRAKSYASSPIVLLYPALPRVFKNFEILCKAMELLRPEVRELLELRLTLSGTENAYARDLYKRFSSVPGVWFIGRQTREQMEVQYHGCDVVLFPSKLETWGLPITEAKARNIPLLVADLPYAHETVGNCDAVTFLPVDDAQSWALALQQISYGCHQFGRGCNVVPLEPFAANWGQLWRLLTHGL